jgi:hypothetical protein
MAELAFNLLLQVRQLIMPEVAVLAAGHFLVRPLELAGPAAAVTGRLTALAQAVQQTLAEELARGIMVAALALAAGAQVD